MLPCVYQGRAGICSNPPVGRLNSEEESDMTWRKWAAQSALMFTNPAERLLKSKRYQKYNKVNTPTVNTSLWSATLLWEFCILFLIQQHSVKGEALHTWASHESKPLLCAAVSVCDLGWCLQNDWRSFLYWATRFQGQLTKLHSCWQTYWLLHVQHLSVTRQFLLLMSCSATTLRSM